MSLQFFASSPSPSSAEMPVSVDDRGGAVTLMLASLFLLGSWPALLTLLERRGRLPQHTYLDYSITNLLAAIVIAVRFGQAGESSPGIPYFFAQLGQIQDNWASVLMAMAGGLAICFGNLVSQYAWAFAGLSVTNIICSSMTVVLEASPGCQEALNICRKNAEVELSSDVSDEAKLLPDPEEPKDGDEDEYRASNEPKPGTAEFIIQVEGRRSIKVFGSHRLLGLTLVFVAGACFSLFSPAINLATNDQLHALRKGVPHLVIYTAFFYFSVSSFALGFCLNVWFLYHPMAGVPASTVGAYARDWNGRHWALLAGLLCGFGNGFQFMGGQAAGYAAADAVQALPLVSTLWGVILFGEYRRSSSKTYQLLAAMLLMFIIAVAVLMASAGQRKAINANAKFVGT